MLHSNRWVYFDTITEAICIWMGWWMRLKKTEFSYGGNDSATPCCNMNLQNMQFLQWVVTSFDFKYLVLKLKTVFINFSPQTSFVNVLQICLIMLNVIIYRAHYFYFSVSHWYLIVSGVENNDGNQG